MSERTDRRRNIRAAPNSCLTPVSLRTHSDEAALPGLRTQRRGAGTGGNDGEAGGAGDVEVGKDIGADGEEGVADGGAGSNPTLTLNERS